MVIITLVPYLFIHGITIDSIKRDQKTLISIFSGQVYRE